AASDRRICFYRAVLCDELLHGRAIARRGRGQFGERDHPSYFGDDSLAAALHQSPDCALLPEPAQLTDADRIDNLRPGVCVDREYGGAVPSASTSGGTG